MKKNFKPKSRPRTLADILTENEELESAGKGIPEELIKPHDHVDYYEGMDGPKWETTIDSVSVEEFGRVRDSK